MAKVVHMFKTFCKAYNVGTTNNDVDLFKFVEQIVVRYHIIWQMVVVKLR